MEKKTRRHEDTAKFAKDIKRIACADKMGILVFIHFEPRTMPAFALFSNVKICVREKTIGVAAAVYDQEENFVNFVLYFSLGWICQFYLSTHTYALNIMLFKTK